MEYSVVIPVYNEERVLLELHRRVRAVMESLGAAYEVIYVNDGSKDNSGVILAEISGSDDHAVVVEFDRNYGQHPAVIAGLDAVRGRYVVTLDADLQNPPEEIPKLIARLKEGYDMVSGCRKDRKDHMLRRFPSGAFNFLMFCLTHVKIRDNGTMLRVFTADLARKVSAGYKERMLYIPVLVSKLTKNILEIDVEHEERAAGVSRYNYTKLIKMTINIFLRYNDSLFNLLVNTGFLRSTGPIYRTMKTAGLALEQDAYDSGFYKLMVGRIKMTAPGGIPDIGDKLKEIDRECEARRYRYVVFNIPDDMKDVAESAGKAGFSLCVTNVDFKMPLPAETSESPKDVEVSPAGKEDMDAVRDICAKVFKASRFYHAGVFGNDEVAEYHRKWIGNIFADKNKIVLAARVKGKVAGFAAFEIDAKEKTARIILIGVDENAQGTGVGRALMKNVINTASKEAGEIFVKTQVSNPRACAFYEKSGFKRYFFEHVYHKVYNI